MVITESEEGQQCESCNRLSVFRRGTEPHGCLLVLGTKRRTLSAGTRFVCLVCLTGWELERPKTGLRWSRRHYDSLAGYVMSKGESPQRSRTPTRSDAAGKEERASQ